MSHPTHKSMFVAPIKKNEFIMSDYNSQHRVKHCDHHTNVHVRFFWVCHYCGCQDHIRPYYYKNLCGVLEYLGFVKSNVFYGNGSW